MWILLAVAASVLWGFTYVIQEFLFRNLAVSTYLAIVSFAMTIFSCAIGISQNSLLPNLKKIFLSRELVIWITLAIVIYIAAELCIGFSIKHKNATLAGLIEVSYPLFIALFAWLLFKQNHLTLSTGIGGILIMSGVAIISFSNNKAHPEGVATTTIYNGNTAVPYEDTKRLN